MTTTISGKEYIHVTIFPLRPLCFVITNKKKLMAERTDWIQRLKDIQYNTIQFINALLLFKQPLLALTITPVCETLTYRFVRLS